MFVILLCAFIFKKSCFEISYFFIKYLYFILFQLNFNKQKTL